MQTFDLEEVKTCKLKSSPEIAKVTAILETDREAFS